MDESDKIGGLLKRLKNIESKNKDQLDAIKDQRKNQLDAIERQKENKPEIIEKDSIVHPDKIDKLFEMYPKFFTSESKKLLKRLAKNKNNISYKNLSYKIMLLDGKIHEFSFLKEYGTLYSLLKDLITIK